MKLLQRNLFSIVLLMGLFSHQYCCAQQNDESKPVNLTPADMRAATVPANYTFRLLHIPGNTPGYVVLNNSKPVYLFRGTDVHAQAAAGNAVLLTKRADVEKAAALSIEKIKRGENPALRSDEIEKLIINKPAEPATPN